MSTHLHAAPKQPRQWERLCAWLVFATFLLVIAGSIAMYAALWHAISTRLTVAQALSAFTDLVLLFLAGYGLILFRRWGALLTCVVAVRHLHEMATQLAYQESAQVLWPQLISTLLLLTFLIYLAVKKRLT